jgi:ADP-ribosyl-[dinitrogen reductase] hydrolase
MTNRETLEFLFAGKLIDIRRSALFDTAPPELPTDLDFDRVEGMLLGLAVGDSLGNTTEGLLPASRRLHHGEVRDYLPNEHAGRRRLGLPSDDTQLAFWTLDQLLEDGRLEPERLGARFAAQRIFGIGSTVREFLGNLQRGREWYRCGPKSAGNGALMRIAPVLIPHLRAPSAELWVDTALAAMLTHNDSASISACLAVVSVLWQLLAMKEPPPPAWWLESYVRVARELETGDAYRPRGGAYSGFAGPLWRFVEQFVAEAHDKDLPTLEACEGWYSGAYLLETVPSVLYILMRHAGSFEEAVVRAVNDTRDNDTVAAIVGALAGALHGRRGIPRQWLARHSGRTGEQDDGRISLILGRARARFAPQASGGKAGP